MKSILLYFEKNSSMKKIAVIIVLVFVITLIISSCNRDVCPAYSKAETEQPEQVG